MFDLTPIAQAHNVPTQELADRLAGAGWDFTALDHANEAHVAFVTRLVPDNAAELAAARAKREAAEAKRTANRLASMTAAARATPDAICGRCDGKGTIRGFGHVAGGVCFACSGAGVIRWRGALYTA